MNNFLCTSLIALFLCSSQACSNGNIELEEAVRVPKGNKKYDFMLSNWKYKMIL